MDVAPKNTKNIIFDLGGVLLNLDYNLTAHAFKKLGANFPNIDAVYSNFDNRKLFEDIETGHISETHFRNELKRMWNFFASDSEIDTAWNAMLLDLPKQRLQLLRDAKTKGYRVFLLSNTNSIHIASFYSYLLTEFGISNWEKEMFEKIYLSHEIKLRKPNREIFDFALHYSKLNASETIFIDDSPQHVEGSRQAGINSFLLEKNNDVCDLIKKLQLL